MEMEIMVGGNEIHQNAIDLGFELFIHWSQYRRNFHREIDNEANVIKFQSKNWKNHRNKLFINI